MMDKAIRFLYRHILIEKRYFFKRNNRVMVRYSDGTEHSVIGIAYGYDILKQYSQEEQWMK